MTSTTWSKKEKEKKARYLIWEVLVKAFSTWLTIRVHFTRARFRNTVLPSRTNGAIATNMGWCERRWNFNILFRNATWTFCTIAQTHLQWLQKKSTISGWLLTTDEFSIFPCVLFWTVKTVMIVVLLEQRWREKRKERQKGRLKCNKQLQKKNVRKPNSCLWDKLNKLRKHR